MQPDEPTTEEPQEELPEDNGTPFQPAAPSLDPTLPPDDSGQTGMPADDTHPLTDTNIDSQEQYDEGVPGAEPSAANDVTSYASPDDAVETPDSAQEG